MEPLTIIILVLFAEALIEIAILKISAQVSYAKELRGQRVQFRKSALQWIILQAMKILIFAIGIIILFALGVNI